MVEISTLDAFKELKLKDVSAFNDETVPHRAPHYQYDTFRFVANPYSQDYCKFIYIAKVDGEYIGQMLTIPVPMLYNDKLMDACWGQDYFVKEKWRNAGLGQKLAAEYLKRNYIAVGFSPGSAVVHRKMGAKTIGYLDIFYKWSHPLKKIKFIFHRVLKLRNTRPEAYVFPQNINVDNVHMVRVTDPKNLKTDQVRNKDCYEPVRTAEYLQWRFFYNKSPYTIYTFSDAAKSKEDYIIFRPVFYRGVNWLKVVDYRCDVSEKNIISLLIKSSEKLAQKLKLYGVIFPSSMQKISQNLKRNKFRLKKHLVVLSTIGFDHREIDENAGQNDHIFLTFADSDLDMHNNDGKFIFEA